MTAWETQQLKELIEDLKKDMTKRMDDLDAKIDRASDFQSSFQGVARTLMWIVIVVGAITTTYAALHGTFTGTH